MFQIDMKLFLINMCIVFGLVSLSEIFSINSQIIDLIFYQVKCTQTSLSSSQSFCGPLSPRHVELFPLNLLMMLVRLLITTKYCASSHEYMLESEVGVNLTTFDSEIEILKI